MAFAWLFTIWFVPSFALLGYVAFLRRRTLMRVGSAASIAKYLLTSTIDHAAFATQGAALTLLAADFLPALPQLVAVGAGAVLAFCLAYMALDVALFVQGGLRLQWQFVAFTSALKDFAGGKAWAGQAIGIAGGALAACLSCAWAFGALLHNRSTTFDWQCLPAIAAAISLSAVARRTLPVFFMYEWTNPFVVGQVKASNTLLQRLRRKTYTQLRDSRGVPKALVPQCERSTAPDPAFPLLRQVESFEGPKHFELARRPKNKTSGHTKDDTNATTHVVCLFLESFRAADVGALGSRHNVTPHFDALCAEGVLWSRFYATGTYTAPALTAAIFGVLPRFAGSSLQMHLPPIALFGLPHLFAKEGYTTAFFSDGPMDWENKREFFLRNGYSVFFGPPSLLDAYPQASAERWSFDDAYLMRFHSSWLAQQEALGKSTFSTLLTVTNHHPFTAPPHAQKPNTAGDVSAQSDYYNYLRTIQYTDACLGAYVAELRARGLYDKTTLVIMGDHGQQVTFEHKMDWSGQYHDSGVRVPLLIVAPKLAAGGKVINELGSQIDVVPTLMDLFNFDGAHHACGTSLLRRCETRHAITLHPWKPGLYVSRFGDLRYVHSLETDVAALYDIARDPREQQDVSGQYAALFAAQKKQVALLRDWLETLYMRNGIVPADLGRLPTLPRLPKDALTAPPSLKAVQQLIDVLRQDAQEAARTEMVKTAEAAEEDTSPAAQAPHRLVEARLIQAYTLCLGALWLPEAKRLRAAHLLGHRLCRVYTGEMTNAERSELGVLLQHLTRAPAGHVLPAWLRYDVPSFIAHFS